MRLMALLTFIFVWSVQVYSMEVRDPFECLPGARPFAGIKIKGEAAEQLMRNFEEFRTTRKNQRNKINEFKSIETVAAEIIETPSHVACGNDVLQGIREWVSKPVHAASGATCVPGEDRIFSVDFDTLAKVLSIRAKKPVTAQELSELVEDTKNKNKQYSMLRFFAQKVLNFPHCELEQLNSWLVGGNNGAAAIPSSNRLLKCNIDLVFKLFNARVDRDIADEFGHFVEEYNEKEDRIFLKEDFDAYTTGPSAPSCTMTSTYEEFYENGVQTSRMAFPKGYDISVALMTTKNDFFANLTTGIDNSRYRIYDCFLVGAQYSGVEICHAEFMNHSKINIENGLIYQDVEVLNTGDTVWALNAHKELRIFPQKKSNILGGAHHSYLFQEDSVGLPAACAGHMEVRNGKISKIDRSSGHYSPVELQLLLAISYFHKIDIIADDVILNGSGYSTGYSTLAEALSIANMIELT